MEPKLKLIFNTEKTLDRTRFPRLPCRESARLRYLSLGLARELLAFSMVFAVPAVAQQSDSEPPAQAPPQAEPAITPDPPADDSTESMFPPFNHPRFSISAHAT